MTSVLDRLALEAVVAPLEAARPLPRAAFVDPAWFAVEARVILHRAWRVVAREAELALPGQWRCARIGEPGVIVTRGEDLLLRAFHNVCAHRAVPLVSAERGEQRRFECPYHGYTYDLAGKLIAGPFHVVPPLALSPVRVDAWGGFVLACPDGAAPSLPFVLRGVPEALRRAPLERLALLARREHEVRANWKVMVGNFQESHHFPRVHPELEGLTPARDSDSFVSDGAWFGGTMQLRDDADTVSPDGTLGGRPRLPGLSDADRRRVTDALLFPLWMLSLQPDYLLSYSLEPLAVDRTRVRAEIYVDASFVESGGSSPELVALWDRIDAQDRAICEAQQRGLSTDAWRPTHYAPSEDGLHAFERRVAERLLGVFAEEGP